jgi:hypothetical protein
MAFKNIITGLAAIDDLVKCAGVFEAQSTCHGYNPLEHFY